MFLKTLQMYFCYTKLLSCLKDLKTNLMIVNQRSMCEIKKFIVYTILHMHMIITASKIYPFQISLWSFNFKEMFLQFQWPPKMCTHIQSHFQRLCNVHCHSIHHSFINVMTKKAQKNLFFFIFWKLIPNDFRKWFFNGVYVLNIFF